MKKSKHQMDKKEKTNNKKVKSKATDSKEVKSKTTDNKNVKTKATDNKEVKNKTVNNKTKNNKAKINKSIKKKIILLVFIICVIVLVGVAIYLIKNWVKSNNDKGKMADVQEYMISEDVDNDTQIEKLKEMQKKNNNIKCWIKIDDTKINYPVLQSEDNEYYLDHDYEEKESKYGSIFLKAASDINDSNSNLMIYGHNMKDGEMFTGIMQYADKAFWDNHKTVHLITDGEAREYEIIAAFRSRVFYKNEKNVFRFYNYLNFKDEKEYTEYINNVKKAQLYDTGITAEYGEQLMTLITCEYSQENGRFVVIAKRVS